MQDQGHVAERQVGVGVKVKAQQVAPVALVLEQWEAKRAPEFPVVNGARQRSKHGPLNMLWPQVEAHPLELKLLQLPKDRCTNECHRCHKCHKNL